MEVGTNSQAQSKSSIFQITARFYIHYLSIFIRHKGQYYILTILSLISKWEIGLPLITLFRDIHLCKQIIQIYVILRKLLFIVNIRKWLYIFEKPKVQIKSQNSTIQRFGLWLTIREAFKNKFFFIIIISMSYPYHIYVTFMSYLCHIHIISTSYPHHIHLISMSYLCHIPTSYPLHIQHHMDLLRPCKPFRHKRFLRQ